MSEKRARQKRAELAQAPQPEQQGNLSVNDLLQLVGTKEAQIMILQRQVTSLQQQTQTLAEQLAKKEEAK